jgi:tetraacyldisaccharide 4'-kinase
MSSGQQQRLRRPVVSVGNLAAGGRGKTPVVQHIARLLIDAGERPAILSRGYGRRDIRPGAVVVSDGPRVLADVDQAGDEPLMLAHAVPEAAVVVCEDRRVAGALAEAHLGATVHLLDDGFQHLVLARDVDLVLVTPADLAARAFPFGHLRESPRALAAADAVLVDGDATGVEWPPTAAARFAVRRSLGRPVCDGLAWEPAHGPILALAGIARPHRFADALSASGWTVAETMAFGDHHRYTPRDVTRVNTAARRVGAVGIVTTAKDAVRLPEGAAWAVPVAVAALEAVVAPAEPFRTWLLGRLAEARS